MALTWTPEGKRKRGRPEKPGEGQQRKRATRWGGLAGGQQRKAPGKGPSGEIYASPYAPQGVKRIDEMRRGLKPTIFTETIIASTITPIEKLLKKLASI